MITIFLVLLTAVVSYFGFNDMALRNKLLLHPYIMHGNTSQWYRFITHGFVHADWMHLIFNMLALYSFGSNVEYIFGSGLYLVFYLTALIASSFGSYWQKRSMGTYRSLGASGATSAIVFSSIIFSPWSTIYLYFLPVPAILFGVLYIGISIYMSKRNFDNIDHQAHYQGALFGILFTLLFIPNALSNFLSKITQLPF
jgi:membrane associated rhomboid family serine protease